MSKRKRVDMHHKRVQAANYGLELAAPTLMLMGVLAGPVAPGMPSEIGFRLESTRRGPIYSMTVVGESLSPKWWSAQLIKTAQRILEISHD
jgi:hypothetical protein